MTASVEHRGGQRLFVTGASGFIGSHVVRLALSQGWHVATSQLPSGDHRLRDVASQLTVFKRDEALSDQLWQWKPKAAIHLAWIATPGVYLDSHENIECLDRSIRLLDDLIQVQCGRVVMVGSCAEYAPSTVPLREGSPLGPHTLYAACKASLSMIGQQMAKAAGQSFAWARLFQLYGPAEDRRRVIPALVNAILDGDVFAASSGDQLRDYLCVEDVAAGLLTLAERDDTGIFNVCSGEAVTMRHVLELTAQIVGRPGQVLFGAAPSRGWDPAYLVGSSDKLRSLGWRPRHTLEAGLRQTVEWWIKHR